MSARCVGWAFALQADRSARGMPLSPAEQLVLLHLADRYSNQAECAWPSYADTVARTGLSERGARNALDELERLGIIRREPRLNERKRKVGTIVYLPLYQADWASERIGYDFDPTTGRYDPETAAENVEEMGARFAGMFAGGEPPASDAVSW